MIIPDVAWNRDAMPGVRPEPLPPPAPAPLRILLASDYYPPFIGGVQRQIRLLAGELTRRGHQVEVATLWGPGTAARENDGGVGVNRLRQVRTLLARDHGEAKRHPPPLPDPVTVLGLRRVIRRFRPDVVHSYGWFSYSCAVAMAGTSVPLILSARDYAHGCATRTLLHRGAPCSGPQFSKCMACSADYYGWPKGAVATVGVRASDAVLARRVDGLHSISAYVREHVRRNFVDDRAVRLPHRIIPSFQEGGATHAEDDPAVAPRIAELPKEPFILFVGAFRREKGLAPLLEAYRRLGPAPPLVLIGTWERDTPLAFPPGVVPLTDFPHPAVMAAWRRSLFGVIPSLWPEPLGSVVYEGMSCGRAVIGTTPGGHADMIEDGATGFLVPSGDVEALADAMRRLIDDGDMRRRFGTLARARAQRYTAEVAVPQFEELYRRVLGAEKRTR